MAPYHYFSNQFKSSYKNVAFLVAMPIMFGLILGNYPSKALSAQSKKQEGECVILLHGLGRTFRSMNPMEQYLVSNGYGVVNVNYASTRYPIEQLAEKYISSAISQCREQYRGPIHFVTHSMGGMLVRYFLSRHSMADLGKVVMLSPPNQGSEVVDNLGKYWIFNWYHGPAGRQLGTGPDGIAATLGPVTFPVGVITGNTHSFFDGWLAKMIPGEDDGKVSVERARVDGMADFLVLPYAHSFIMAEKEVFAQTRFFLKYGRFDGS